jgi:peptide/nickel transport system permease protein
MTAGYFRGWIDTLISRSIDVLLAFPVFVLAFGLAAACSFGNGCKINTEVIVVLSAISLVTLIGVGIGLARGAVAQRTATLLAVGAVALPLVYLLIKTIFGAPVINPGIGVVIMVIIFVNWTYFARVIRGQVLSLREKEFVEASRSLGASHARIIFREILPNLVAPIIVYTTLVLPTNVLFEAALSFLGVGVQPPTASWGQMIAAAVPIFDSAWWYMLFPGVALVLTVLAFNLVGDGLQDALNPRSDR